MGTVRNAVEAVEEVLVVTDLTLSSGDLRVEFKRALHPKDHKFWVGSVCEAVEAVGFSVKEISPAKSTATTTATSSANFEISDWEDVDGEAKPSTMEALPKMLFHGV